EEKKVKTAAATASAAAAEQQQAKAQTSSATQTAGVAVSSTQPTTSRVVRDKRNIELLQGSAKILQEYRIQLSKALVALKKSGEGSQPAAAAATGVGAQKRKHPEQDPEEGGGTAGGPSSKISRVEKQEQPGESNDRSGIEFPASHATIRYGATVRQLLVDYDGNFDKVNGELYRMGTDIGARLLDEFLIKSRVPPCQDFRDACEVMSKVALKMYLGVAGECVDWDNSTEGRKCRLVLPVNPLNDFVELPMDLRRQPPDAVSQGQSGPILWVSSPHRSVLLLVRPPAIARM
ncbi:Trafficking protein particle complex subunit 3, partial [Perkinsus olseni]